MLPIIFGDVGFEYATFRNEKEKTLIVNNKEKENLVREVKRINRKEKITQLSSTQKVIKVIKQALIRKRWNINQWNTGDSYKRSRGTTKQKDKRIRWQNGQIDRSRRNRRYWSKQNNEYISNKAKRTGKKTWKRIFEKRQRRQDEKKEKTKQGINKSRINNEN